MTNMTPLLTIIVPVYNTERYLEKCLDSLRLQTYTNIEIICVNDGSTDASADILKRYAETDQRFTVITQKNAGLATSRNAALKVAKGEWIGFVDSDDYVEPDTYEKALSHADDSVDLVYFGSHIDVQKEMSHEEKIGLENDATVRKHGLFAYNEEILFELNVYSWSKLWRAAIIKKYNISFPDGLLYEDAFFYHRYMPYTHNIYFLPDKLYHYVQRSGSIMSDTRNQSPRSIEHIYIAELILESRYDIYKSFNETDIHILKSNCDIACSYLPNEKSRILKETRRIAERFQLLRQFPKELAFLKQTTWFSRLFVKRKLNKTSYRFFGITYLTLTKQKGKNIRRLFGIKF